MRKTFLRLTKTPFEEITFEILHQKYVPTPLKEISTKDIENLKEFIDKKNPLIISGAGLSTESGIPDYRSPNGSYSKGHKPMQFHEFKSSESNRKRYWARNMNGFRLFSQVKPNIGHYSISNLQKKGKLNHIITQNVDRLHQKSGSQNVIDLHGNNYEVICLSCRNITSREVLQEKLEALNPQFLMNTSRETSRSDGDAELKDVVFDEFKIPSCETCDGILKPHVVFFGESVPSSIVEHAKELTRNSQGILVLGSSLQVYSSYRFVKLAHDHKIPIGIINIGETRCDEMCSFKYESRCGEILQKINELI